MKMVVIILLILLLSLGLMFGVVKFYERQNLTFNTNDNTKITSPKNSEKPLFAALKHTLKLPQNIIEKTPPHFLPGFDWQLPKNTGIEPYSGFVGEDNHKLSVANNQFIIVRWDKSNPQPGMYDFSSLENKLKSMPQRNALVRLEVNSSCETPAWALKKLRASKEKSLVFWDQQYLDLITPFINAFAQRYAKSPQIVGVQLGIADGEYRGGDCSDYDNKEGWGEFWMSPDALQEAQQNFEFNPEIFIKRSKQIIDIYTKAFGPYKTKLAYTNQGPLFTWGKDSDAYNNGLAEITQYAFDQGLGTRDGGTEPWLRFVDRPYGNHLKSMLDNTCRLDFDEDYANSIEGRYWGTENEFYGKVDYVLDSYGPYENQPYRFLISTLRALQMRRNFITLSDQAMLEMDHPVYKTQAFLDYLNKTMGKRKENTPDAFVLLGERYIKSYRARYYRDEQCVKNNGDKIPIRSFGRWLTESSIGTPAVKVSMPESENYWGQGYYLPEGTDYEYFARQSDLFHFDLNDQLSKKRCKVGGCLVEIKATFQDTEKTQLTAYVEEGKSQSFQTVGDKKIKTVSFTMKSKFENGLSGSDVLLITDNAPISLILLRVNFL